MYLSEIHFLQISEGARLTHSSQLYFGCSTSCRVSKGVRHKSRARKDLDCQCPPSILRKLKRVWEEESSQPNKDYALGSLLSGILWVFEDRKNDGAKSGSLRPAVHLNKEDVAVDDPAAPSEIRIAIKQSKKDLVQEGHKYLPGKDIIGPLPSICHPQLPSGKGVTKRPFISAE